MKQKLYDIPNHYPLNSSRRRAIDQHVARNAPDINRLFEQNRAWAKEIESREPGFFAALSRQQSPQYLWIGCSDSRVPANQIVGLVPGEVFVHRNVGNVAVHTDLNYMSALQYAVDVLGVRHVLVVGHYGCGGVLAALHGRRLGLIDNWLRHIQDIRIKHAALLDSLPESIQAESLCELNVIEQVLNVCRSTVVHEAWQSGQKLSVHGWVYSLSDGLIRDLHISLSDHGAMSQAYDSALAALPSLAPR
ncbi:MAG: carbonate dehydratase [Verrucomicrobia bacterium]|nr:carbonate dehydratase [Verrucomicrobiota bacterium]MBV8375785.1 carbonate dehydratase [Verrucomicrobiota bacterium]